MTRIILFGPLPPPTGGVSIHVERLNILLSNMGFSVQQCDESKIIKENVFNIRSLRILRYLKEAYKADIVHIHSSLHSLRLFHIIISFLLGKKIIITLHSWRSGKFITWLWKEILNFFCDKIIFVSGEVAEKIHTRTVKRLVFPAFLPPNNTEAPLNEHIIHFISRARKKSKKILVSNAFRIVEHNGVDLYGLDICLDVFSAHKCYENAVLIYIISDPSVNPDKIKKYKSFIEEKKITSSVLIHCGAIDFCHLLKLADASIRATNTDGDAISIRESLYLGVPCIASDCTKRPSGTILFNTRSSQSLASAILKIGTTTPVNSEINEDSIHEFYSKLYQG